MDFVAEIGNPLFQSMHKSLLLVLVECRSTTLLVDLAGLEQRVDRHKYLMGYRHNRLLFPTSRRQAAEVRAQERPTLPDCCPGCLYQGCPQILVSTSQSRRLALARALVLSWHQACPAAHVSLALEAAHIRPQLRHDHLGRPLPNPRDRVHDRLRRPRPFRRRRLLLLACRPVSSRISSRPRRRLGCFDRLADALIKGCDVL